MLDVRNEQEPYGSVIQCSNENVKQHKLNESIEIGIVSNIMIAYRVPPTGISPTFDSQNVRKATSKHNKTMFSFGKSPTRSNHSIHLYNNHDKIII